MIKQDVITPHKCFHFFEEKYESGLPIEENDKLYLYVESEDLPALKEHMQLNDNNKIKQILTAAYGKNFIKIYRGELEYKARPYNGLLLDQSGRNYVNSFYEKRSAIRREWIVPIIVALIGLFGSFLISKFTAKNETKLFLEQNLHLNTKIETTVISGKK